MNCHKLPSATPFAKCKQGIQPRYAGLVINLNIKNKMIFPIILITLAILIIMVCIANREDIFLAAVFSGSAILPIVMSITIHTSDLALTRKGNVLIQIREQAIKKIDEQLNEIKINNSALMNADSPARSLIETKAKFVSELTEQKIKIQKAKMSIESRSIGLFKVVVWIYGKE